MFKCLLETKQNLTKIGNSSASKETYKCGALIIYKLQFFNSSVNNERIQNMKITICKPLLTLINSIIVIPVSCHFENNAHVKKPGLLTFVWLRSCTPRRLHFSPIYNSAVLFQGFYVNKKGMGSQLFDVCNFDNHFVQKSHYVFFLRMSSSG